MGKRRDKDRRIFDQKIMKLVEEENKKEIRDIKIDLALRVEECEEELSFVEGAKWMLEKINKK